MFQRILLGLDDSESGQLAISFATALAGAHSAAVHVLHVNQYLLGGRGFMVATAREADALLANALRELQSAGVQANGNVAAAACVNVGSRIAETATAVGADVIVLGSRRRRGLARLGAGGIREQVTRVTWLPVLVAPSPLTGLARRRAGSVPDSLQLAPRSAPS